MRFWHSILFKKKGAPPFLPPLFFLKTPPFFLKWEKSKFSHILATHSYIYPFCPICTNSVSSGKTRTYPISFCILKYEVTFGVIFDFWDPEILRLRNWPKSDLIIKYTKWYRVCTDITRTQWISTNRAKWVYTGVCG